MTIRRLILMCALVAAGAGLSAASALATPNVPDSATGFLLNGRQLTPQGVQVGLGDFPTGGAVTADGRFLWTVSAGQGANVILVYGWNAASGKARFLRAISVGSAPDAALVQAFPLAAPGAPGSTNAWPQKLAVSPDGRRLLAPLNRADSAAVVSLETSDTVHYVSMGSGAYSFGAAILPTDATAW